MYSTSLHSTALAAPSRLFSDRYAQLLAAAGATRDPGAEPAYEISPAGTTLTERLLQCIWFDQLVRPGALRTAGGTSVRVLAPGFWNFEAGPDFHRAELQFGEAPPVQGDVEVHLRPEGWHAHGHGRDARYNSTILHVVFHNPRHVEAVRTAAGVAIPELALADVLVDQLDALRARLETDDYPYASPVNVGQCCHHGLTGTSPPFWELVALAGEARLLLKARRAAALGEDWDHVCYAMLLQALGYKAFAGSCRELARRAPYAQLRCIARDAGVEALHAVQAALLGMAGLLPDDTAHVAPAARTYADGLVHHWATLRSRFSAAPMMPAAWQAPHVRPTNRPARRLVAAAHLIATTVETGLAHALRESAGGEGAPRVAWRGLERLLTVESDPFWAHRASVAGKAWTRAQRLVGPGRARVLAIDAVVPALLAWARATHDTELEGRLHALVSAAPAQGPNAKLRLALYRMTGVDGSWPPAYRTALHGQGLLHLLQEWCVARPTCEGCGVWRVLGTRGPTPQNKRAKAP